MKRKLHFNSFGLLVTALFLASAFLAFSPARAQQVKVDVGKPEVDTQLTPDFNAGNVKDKRFKPRKWLEIEVPFKAVTTDKSGFVDELTFKYHIYVKGVKQPIMLVGDIIHVNIMGGESSYSVAYVAPTTLARVAGIKPDLVSKRSLEGIAIAVYYRGQLVGGEADRASSRWWEKMAQTPGYVLNKSQTPYAHLWYSRYAEIKPVTAR